MTREEAKELLPIIKAFADGKTIQFRERDVEEPSFDGCLNEYRIKPEPKFRPFKNQEECWQEMLKHQPFGWLRNTYTKRLHNIDSIGHTTYGITLDNNCITYFDVAFDAYNFADGTPFGIMED